MSEPLAIEAAGQKYLQTSSFTYLGTTISDVADLDVEIKRRVRLAWFSFRKYSRVLYDRAMGVSLELKVRMLKAEVLEALLYGCATWTMTGGHYDQLRTVHHRLLRRCVGSYKENKTDHVMSYQSVLEKTGCETIETTVRRRRLLLAGNIARMDKTRLPKRMMYGRIADDGRPRGGLGKKKSWAGCLKDDFGKFVMETAEWEKGAMVKSVWKEKVAEGAVKSMGEWMTKETDLREKRHAKAAAKERSG